MDFTVTDDTTPDTLSFGNATAAQHAEAAKYAVPNQTGTATALGGDIAFAPLDLADALGSSKVVSWATGLQRGDLNRMALHAINSPGLTNFYENNKEGIETASGIAGVVGSTILADALTEGLGGVGMFKGAAALQKLPYVRRIATLDAEYANALQTVRNVDSSIASRGALGLEQFTGEATVDSLRYQAGGTFVLKPTTIARDKAWGQAVGTGFLKGARNAAVNEAVLATGLNQNGFLYQDSAAQNLFWQAAGIGIGGAAEWLHGAYSMRKFVNSDMIRRQFAAALDPVGLQEGRLLWQGKKVAPLTSTEGYLGGSNTDYITHLLVDSEHLETAPATQSSDNIALLRNRESLATQQRKLAQERLNQTTTKGVTTDGDTRFTTNAPGYGNHLDMTLKRDAAALYGVEMIGGVPESKTALGIDAARSARIQERIKETEEQLNNPLLSPEEHSRLGDLRRQLDYEDHLVGSVILDGEKMPMTEAATIEGFNEPEIINTVTKNADKTKSGLWETKPKGVSIAPVSIDHDFAIHFPTGKTLDTSDHFDILRLYRAAGRAIDSMKNWDQPLLLPAKPNWFQLDMAEEILQRNPEAKIQWPQGMTRDSAQVESLAQKSDAVAIQKANIDIRNLKLQAKGLDPESQLSRMRVRYNLPKLTAYERGVTGETDHPVESLLRGVDKIGPNQLRQMTLDDVKESVAQVKRIGDLAPVSGADMSIRGNSFSYMLDESGNPVRPMIVYSRPFQQTNWNPDFLTDRLVARKMATVASMTDANAGPLTKGLTESAMNSPDFDLASRTHELYEPQVQGSVSGAANQTQAGSLWKSVVQTEFRDRDNPILQAATRLFEGMQRVTADAMKRVITGTFGDSLNQLANPRNASTKVLLAQFHSFAGGWDLATSEVKRADGFHEFALSDTEKNRLRWKQQYNTELPKGQTLLSPEGRPVVLDDRALDVQKRYNMVTDQIIAEKNTILRSLGMGQIDRVNWYVPPPNTKGKFIGMVIGPDGQSVPGMGVVASTPQEFETLKQGILDRLTKEGKGFGWAFRTQDQIREFASIWDRAQMDWIHPGTTAAQPNRSGRGVLAGSNLNLNTFEESLQFLRDQYLNHAKDVTETLLKEQLNAAKARAQISSVLTKTSGGTDVTKFRSIYDMYIENLTGRSKLKAEGSEIGRITNPIEGFINTWLSERTPGASALAAKTSNLMAATNGWLNRINPYSKNKAAADDFSKLSAALGQHMPFADAAALLEAKGFGAKPWTAAEIGGKVNQFSAAMLLRLFEVGQPLMNMAGMVNSMPAVIRSFTPRMGESTEEFAARVGHAASIFNLPNGQSVGVADMAKLGAAGLQRALRISSHADYDYMLSRGFITQEVAEFHKQFGAIESKGAWQRFFLGDHTITNPQSISEKFATKGVVGWLSVLSDKSEDLSRAWGHMTGLELADHLGIHGIDARNAFAHDIANKMIANYSPTNRPEIFQGALGAPLGLFQSFIQNYYQRLFRYVETKDFGSLMAQYGTQGALFGMTSLPGWHEFNTLMANHGEGDTPDDPTSVLHHRLGGPLGDLLAGGVLSNLPRLFGAPALDLYSRGDTAVRLPGTVAVPAVALVKKLMDGIGQGIQAFASGHGEMTPGQLAEIASTMMPNRPLAGMIEQAFAHGNKTDMSGQLVTTTNGAMEAAYRIVGMRSERQSREIEAYYANRNAQQHQAANSAILRLSTRAAIRSGNFEAVPGIYQKYLENGGNPAYFRRWFQSNYKAATSTRGQRELESALKDPTRMAEVVRLMDAGVSINSDEQSPDPGSMYGNENPSDELEQPNVGPAQYDGQMTVP